MHKGTGIGAAMMYNDHPGGKSLKVPSPKRPSGMRLSRVEIEPADNGGFTVTCFHRPAEGKRDIGPISEPKRNVFEDKAGVLAYIDKVFG